MDINNINEKSLDFLGGNPIKQNFITQIKLLKKQYKFIDMLSENENSVIFSVRDKISTRRLAIKLLAINANANRDVFSREAQIVAILEHPNIIPIHDIHIDSADCLYYTMKLLEGDRLSRILSKLKHKDSIYKKDYDLNLLLESFLKICNGVSFAHSKKVLNLNLNPSNIQIGSHGEVYIMDWSYAKFIQSNKGAGTNTIHNIMLFDIPTKDNIYGKPGFVAPEQIEDPEGSDYWSATTDVFSLGAILYNILTFEISYKGHNDDETLKNTLHFSAEKIEIESKWHRNTTDLSLIVRKALSNHPKNRYKSVSELSEDVSRFIRGEATKVHPDNFPRKFIRITKKYKHIRNIIIIIVLFLISGLLWVNHQYQKTLESWNPEIEFDMSSYPVVNTNFELSKKSLKSGTVINKKLFNSSGIKLPIAKWLWLSKHHFAKSLRIEIDFSWDNKNNIDGFDICFNSIKNNIEDTVNMPKGYSVQIGGWQGKVNLLSINRGNTPLYMTNATTCKINDNRKHKLVIERNKEFIDIYLDNNKILSEIDPIPFNSGSYGGVGFRSWSNGLFLHNVSIFTRLLPIYSSPLEVGDAFVREGFYKRAAREYQQLYDNHYNSEITEMALRKYIKMCKKLNQNELAEQLIIDFQDNYPNSSYIDKIIEDKILSFWMNYDFDKVFLLFETLDNDLKKVMIARKLLNEKHFELPYTVADKFLKILALKDVHFSLDISDYGIKSLDNLADLNLKILNCENNQISSLLPLENMAIQVLKCANNKISDISPLKNMPLQTLDISNNTIKTLVAFKHKKLIHFSAINANLNSLAFLLNQPLKTLNITYNPIKSLAPLNNIKSLDNLYATYTNIKDYSSLSESKLKRINIGYDYDGQKINIQGFDKLDLSKISLLTAMGVGLKKIKLINSYNIKSLNIADNNIDDLSFLSIKNHENLKNLNISNNPIISLNILGNFSFDNLSTNNVNTSDISYLLNKNFKKFPDFFNCNIKKENLIKLKQNMKQEYARNIDIIIVAFIDKKYELLKSMAFDKNNKKYLFIKQPLSYKDAMIFAKAAGGHLVKFETKEEFFALLPNLIDFTGDIWIGLQKENEVLKWNSGNKLSWNIFIRNSSLKSEKYMFFSQIANNSFNFGEIGGNINRSFMIEWED